MPLPMFALNLISVPLKQTIFKFRARELILNHFIQEKTVYIRSYNRRFAAIWKYIPLLYSFVLELKSQNSPEV